MKAAYFESLEIAMAVADATEANAGVAPGADPMTSPMGNSYCLSPFVCRMTTVLSPSAGVRR